MTERGTVLYQATWPVARDAVARVGASASRKHWAPDRCLMLSERGLVLLINGKTAVDWFPHSIDAEASDWVVILPSAES